MPPWDKGDSMYVVIKMFDDLQDMQIVGGIRTYHRYRPGDAYPREGYRPTSARVRELLTGANALRRPLIAMPEALPEDGGMENSGAGQAAMEAERAAREAATAAKAAEKAAKETEKAAGTMAKAAKNTAKRKPVAKPAARKTARQASGKKAGS